MTGCLRLLRMLALAGGLALAAPAAFAQIDCEVNPFACNPEEPPTPVDRARALLEQRASERAVEALDRQVERLQCLLAGVCGDPAGQPGQPALSGALGMEVVGPE